MPKYDECSIYEKACQDGTCSHKNSNANRTITVTDGHETWEMPFDSYKLSDSEMLHHILCYIRPGDNYTVTFKNMEK